MEYIRTLPFSKEAESYVLGCILIDSTYAKDVILQLAAKDFHNENNKNVMKAIINLVNNNIDCEVANVIEELKRLRLYEAIGGNQYLFDLIESVPTTININNYIDIVKEKALQRELYQTASGIVNLVLDNKYDFNTLLCKTEKALDTIIEKRRATDFLRIDTASDTVFNIINDNSQKAENDITGIDTGFEELYKVTFGFQKGELIILAARPAVGKSALALNFAINASEYKNATVAFFSLEMSIDQLVMRMLASLSGISLMKLRNGDLKADEMAALKVAKQHLDTLDIYMDDQYTNDVTQIADKCKKLKNEHKVDLIIIDYLQLLKATGSGNRVEEVGRISRGLKMLAREVECPVIALSQLSRDLEKREDKRPVLADLRESGSIEQDADIVMFLYRDISNKVENVDRIKNARTELIIAKNRQCMTTTINLLFNGAQSLFNIAPNTKEK